jgi:hypothetical protein
LSRLIKLDEKKITLNGAAGEIFGENGLIAKFSRNGNPNNVQKMAPQANFLTPAKKKYV